MTRPKLSKVERAAVKWLEMIEREDLRPWIYAESEALARAVAELLRYRRKKR